MSRYCFVCFTLFLIVSQVCFAQVSSVEFNQAVDAAVSKMVSSSSFISYVNNNLPLSSPTCSVSPSYPSRNPIPSSTTTLKMCYEDAQDIEQVWINLYKLVGDSIVSNINSNYGLSLKSQFVLVNTTELGYFETMKNYANDAKCDVVVSDTTITSERVALVNFASCPYGYSIDAFLRSDLDIDIYPNFTSLAEMDKPNIKIGYYLGSTYEDIVNQTFKYAQRVPTNYDDQFDLVGNKQVHAIIADAFDLTKWKSNNANLCTKCYVKTFGSGSSYGVFTAKTSRSSSGMRVQMFIGLIVAVLFLMNLII